MQLSSVHSSSHQTTFVLGTRSPDCLTSCIALIIKIVARCLRPVYVCLLECWKTCCFTRVKVTAAPKPPAIVEKPIKVDDCSICLGENKDLDMIKLKECEHVFHPICIRDWFNTKHNPFSCPNCNHVYKGEVLYYKVKAQAG